MSKPGGLSFGLNLSKRPAAAKPRPPPRKAAFGGGDSDDEAQDTPKTEEAITELDGFTSASTPSASANKSNRPKNGKIPPEPPKLKSKVDPSRQFGDLSSALTSKKYADQAEALDPSVYDYDAAYDAIEAVKKHREAEEKKDTKQRKARYMTDVTKAAEQRERDRSTAEMKKIQREREAEGDEFADKEKFVTEAYKKKQVDDRLAEEEEKKREQEGKKKNKFGGMTGFHKELLEREDQRRLELEKMAAEVVQSGGLPKVEDEEKEKTETDVARELNKKGGAVAINEEGDVVDKRQLLRGGLNLGAKKKTEEPKERSKPSSDSRPRDQSKGHFASGGKQAMRERQTRMLEAQLEQAVKRSRDEEEEERQKLELEAKSRKTGVEISSAKERYLARKRAAEEAKKNGQQEGL